GDIDLVEAGKPDMGELHHAMRQAKSLRVALGLDESGRGERLQQAVQRRPAQTDAALDLQNAERRLVSGEALQDRDGAIDRAHRAAFALGISVFPAHEVMLVLRRMAMSAVWTYISFLWTRLANSFKRCGPSLAKKRERLWEMTMRWLALLAGLLL